MERRPYNEAKAAQFLCESWGHRALSRWHGAHRERNAIEGGNYEALQELYQRGMDRERERKRRPYVQSRHREELAQVVVSTPEDVTGGGRGPHLVL